jgi:hypothetical protein
MCRQTLQRTDPPSKESYQLSVRLTISGANSEGNKPNRSNKNTTAIESSRAMNLVTWLKVTDVSGTEMFPESL